MPQRALTVAQVGDLIETRSTTPSDVSDRHGVADAELVLDEHQEAGEVVLDDLLRAEAERGADERAPDRERPDVDAEDREHPERTDGPDERHDGARRHRRERVGSLLERSGASGVSGFLPLSITNFVMPRFVSRRRNQASTNVTTTATRIWSGLSTSQPAASASDSFSVLSHTHSHALPGFSPHALVRSATSGDVTQAP